MDWKVKVIDEGGKKLRTLQLGSFVLNVQLLLYLAFGAAGWLVVRYRFRHAEQKDAIIAIAANAFLLWLVAWKGSQVLFDPSGVIRQPLSLLLFDGGEPGRYLASFSAAGYAGWRSRKERLAFGFVMETAFLYLLAGLLSSWMILLVIGTSPIWFYAAAAGISVLFLANFLYQLEMNRMPRWQVYGLWFSLTIVLLLFGNGERPLMVFSFSQQQIIFFIVAAGIIGWSWLDSARVNKQ